MCSIDVINLGVVLVGFSERKVLVEVGNMPL